MALATRCLVVHTNPSSALKCSSALNSFWPSFNKASISFFRKKDETPKAEETITETSVYDEPVPKPPSKDFSPPSDVEATVFSIAKQHFTDIPTIDSLFPNNHVKANVLKGCMEEFEFEIPSHELASLRSLSDVVRYYSIKREALTGEDVLLKSDLPKNIHLMFEPVRFTNETKDYFKGKTAFPKRDTIVTSLKYRNVYKGYKNPQAYEKKKGFQYY